VEVGPVQLREEDKEAIEVTAVHDRSIRLKWAEMRGKYRPALSATDPCLFWNGWSDDLPQVALALSDGLEVDGGVVPELSFFVSELVPDSVEDLDPLSPDEDLSAPSINEDGEEASRAFEELPDRLSVL